MRILFEPDRQPLAVTWDVDLWEAGGWEPRATQAPVDPAAFGVDPLVHL